MKMYVTIIYCYSSESVCSHVTVLKNEKFTLTYENTSSNQLLSNFITKTIVFTKFLPKKCEIIFVIFHTVRVLDTKNANNFSTHHIWVVAGMAGIVFSLEVLNAYIHHHAVEMLLDVERTW